MAAMGTTLGNGFQSTLPRGERPPSFPARSRCCRYFNPRSREGSDTCHKPGVRKTCISIHAPARGATDFSDFFKFFLRISIHAPARGATVDPFFGSLDHVISIHAPARGATFGTLRSIPAASLFQSTLPRGERRCRRRSVLYCSAFQSTLPRGERLEAYFA